MSTISELSAEVRDDNDLRNLKDLVDRFQRPAFSWQHEDYFLLKRMLPGLIANVEVDFPILQIIDDHLKNGATIKRLDDCVCLVRADDEIIAQGDTLKAMLMEAIFALC